ncbi:MAG TPA: sigma-54 dependent transcriptional regulator [Dissulfurispiraceae bacterium]|nr:sigma-54 dependent transcriptional regulator [Dissulfurispiraceae bacterium]
MSDQTGTILLVDDELNTLRVLSAILRKAGYSVSTARTAEEALDRAARTAFDVIVSDYRLPGMDGVALLTALHENNPSLPFVMLTAFGTIEKAVDAIKKGAFNYLAKPVNPEDLLTLIREAAAKSRLLKENRLLKAELRERNSFKNIIGKSIRMQEIFDLVETVARSSSSILIQGESGTGKELVARAIHFESARAAKPFLPIDCTALSEQLLESELFGHEKGAFTGAVERKIGRIELADGGTVFLDEVGELPLSLQKKFLRFLQEREFLRVGGTSGIKVDVRIIAATNRDLDAEIRKGSFREDLFFRLNVVRLLLPPLRERKEDIPLLAMTFLVKFAAVNGKQITAIEPDVVDAFMAHEWPGNVRELENAVERAVVLCPSGTIGLQFLPRSLRELSGRSQVRGDELNLMETERRLLLRVLEKSAWNQTRAAEMLGITRKQLRTKMKNHNLLPSEQAGEA